MQGVVVVDGGAGNGNKDGSHSNPPTTTTRPQPSSTRTTLPPKLLRPFLAVAVLATGFVVLLLLLLGGPVVTLKIIDAPTTVLSSTPNKITDAPTTTRVVVPSLVLERWTRAPAATAWHNMTDEELLWAASWRPSVRRYPYRRVPKVAFMFLTRGPLPLAPLWERFFAAAGTRDRYSVYVHSTPGYRPDFPPTSVFYRRQVPSQVARWGETTMCDAERRLLANALLDPGNERFVLVSESCVPLFPFPTVYRYLVRSRHSFVGAFDDPGPHGRGRYRAALAPEVRRHQWRKGAQWFELERDLAVDVVADARYYPKFKDHCRPPCYVDEHYLPTVLSVEAPARIANRSVTWVDWSRGGAHPATFGAADVDEAFLTRLTTTTEQRQRPCLYNGQPAEACFLFARKFAPSALEPLLNLAPKLLGYG